MQGHGHCAMKLLLQLPHGRMKIGVDVNGAFEEVAIEHGFYGEVANQNRGDGQQDQRQGDHPRRLMRGMMSVVTMVRLRVLVKTFFAVKDQEIHSERIKRGNEHTRQNCKISPT